MATALLALVALPAGLALTLFAFEAWGRVGGRLTRAGAVAVERVLREDVR